MLFKMLLTSAILISASAQANQYVFPKNGQTPEQQEMDEFSCHKWAVGQTGYDPQNAQATVPVSPAPAEATPGSGVGGAARGAVVGATIGAIGGNDKSNAAAKGAAVGVIAGRSRSRRAKQANQDAAAQQQAVSQGVTADYSKATAACLEGKGYTVK